jgi:hypothetical protein
VDIYRVAEDEPEKAAKKQRPLFPGKGKEAIGMQKLRMPNPMFPVSRRELAPSTRDI